MELEYGSQSCNHEAVVAKFQNGILADKSSLKDVKYYFGENRFVSSGNTRKRKVLVSETEHMQYVGANFGPSSSGFSSHSRYYIGIANKKTKKVKLLDCSYFELRPAVMGSVFEAEADMDDDKKEQPTKLEQSDLLTLAFGSLRKQRSAEARQRHTVQSKDLEKVVTDTVKGMSFKVDLPDGIADYLPPINRQAENVEDIYNMNDLISSREQCVLNANVKEFLEKAEADPETLKQKHGLSEIIVDLLNELPKNKATRLRKAKLILYVHYLSSLLHLKHSKELISTQMPDELKVVFREKFWKDSFGSIDTMAKNPKCQLRIKAHILIFLVIISDYKIDNANPIAKHLAMELQSLQTLSNAIGGIMKSMQGKLSITVKCPVPILQLALPFKKNR